MSEQFSTAGKKANTSIIANAATSPAPVQLGDGTNQVGVTTANADGVSNTSNRIPVNARIEGYNGTGWDRLRTAVTGVITSVLGFLNILPVLMYNSTAPSLTNGQFTTGQCDSGGSLLVNPGIYNGALTNEASKSVLTSSTNLLAANASRTYMFIQNQDTVNPIYVTCSQNAAVADGTCTYIGPGASRTWEGGFIPNTAIYAIATGATVIAHVEEAS